MKKNRFLYDVRGSSASEYALIIGTLGLAIVLGNFALRDALQNEMAQEASAIAGTSGQSGASPTPTPSPAPTPTSTPSPTPTPTSTPPGNGNGPPCNPKKGC